MRTCFPDRAGGTILGKKMFDLLLDMNDFVGEQNEQLTDEQKEPWLTLYHEIIAEG